MIDEGVYLCSIHTIHRILAENGELKERRNQLRHPQYKKPELLATGPNQVELIFRFRALAPWNLSRVQDLIAAARVAGHLQP